MNPIRFGTVIKVIAPLTRSEGIESVKHALKHDGIDFEVETPSAKGATLTQDIYTDTQSTQHLSALRELNALIAGATGGINQYHSEHMAQAKEYQRVGINKMDIRNLISKNQYPTTLVMNFADGIHHPNKPASKELLSIEA